MDENEKLAKAQKLSEKAGVPFEEARAALEQNNWDMLDAMIYLQNRGNANQSYGPNEYTTQGNQNYNNQNQYQYQYQSNKSTSFGEAVGKAFHWFVDIVKKGMDNDFVIEKNSINPIRIPITIFVILLFLLNGLALIALIVGLFCGLHYSFQGPDIRNTAEDMNDMFDHASQSAEQFTNDIKGGFKNN